MTCEALISLNNREAFSESVSPGKFNIPQDAEDELAFWNVDSTFLSGEMSSLNWFKIRKYT